MFCSSGRSCEVIPDTDGCFAYGDDEVSCIAQLPVHIRCCKTKVAEMCGGLVHVTKSKVNKV